MTTSPRPTPTATRAAARARAERDALVAELTRSVGRGATPAVGRRHRKGPENRNHPLFQRRKIIDSHHPALASHLREAVRTGTTCSYQPARPLTWEL
jgi:hypothetical protein